MSDARERAVIPVSLPIGLVEEIDRMVAARLFSSRSEALRYGARLVVLLENRLHARGERLAYEHVRAHDRRGRARP